MQCLDPYILSIQELSFRTLKCKCRDILAKNGSAVDAAVAALFCNGVVNMQSMGIGGGFTMTVYHRATKSAYVLDARETAPSSATKKMYPLNSELSKNGRFNKNKIVIFKEKP